MPGKAGGYNNWDFRLDQQVLLLPEAGKGAQIAINSLDVMAHPFHMQYVPWPLFSPILTANETSGK